MRLSRGTLASHSCLRRGLLGREEGNSLIEVALYAPLLILLACYAVNYGYYFLVAIDLTASARSAAEYSIQGTSSPASTSLPIGGNMGTAGSVAALAVGDLGGLYKSSTTASVEVCSSSNGNTGSVVCSSWGPNAPVYTPDTDPEPSMFQLNRVDVVYVIQPPIPLTFFHNSWTPPATFHRMVEMRTIN
jgi:Flp pilus assembly protein TadG